MTCQGKDDVSVSGQKIIDGLVEAVDMAKLMKENERLRAVLDEAIRCQLRSVDFDPIGTDGHRYYGVEATLRSGDNSKQWRTGNYLLIPVDYGYELPSSDSAPTLEESGDG